MYLSLGSSRLVRSSHYFIICFLMALLLLAINIQFMFFNIKKHSLDLPRTPVDEDSYNRIDHYNLIEFTSGTIIDNKIFQLTNRIQLIAPNQINRTNNSRTMIVSNQIVNGSNPGFSSGSKKHSQIGAEPSECEITLSGIQWTAWNLVDLCLSSIGPFTFLAILNIFIILHVFQQKRVTFRPGSVSQGNSRRPTSATVASSLLNGINIIKSSHVNFSLYCMKSNRNRNSKAEKSVTLMLLVITLAFLVMRTPISVGHFVQMLLSEERLFAIVKPLNCMATFAVAEILAFGQHAIQFYVYFACSARFRQALCREIRLILRHLSCLRSHRSPNPPNSPVAPVAESQFHEPIRPTQRLLDVESYANNCNSHSTTCQHEFQWASRHLLVCRLCFSHHLVHNPSCVHYRNEREFYCECLSPPLNRQAHFVVHLRDYFPPIFGITYR